MTLSAALAAGVACLALVTTGGNLETSTPGFNDTLHKAWERSAFELKAGAIRAESTSIARVAVGPWSSSASTRSSRRRWW